VFRERLKNVLGIKTGSECVWQTWKCSGNGLEREKRREGKGNRGESNYKHELDDY
jgi:hypothetical protein